MSTHPELESLLASVLGRLLEDGDELSFGGQTLRFRETESGGFILEGEGSEWWRGLKQGKESPPPLQPPPSATPARLPAFVPRSPIPHVEALQQEEVGPEAGETPARLLADFAL